MTTTKANTVTQVELVQRVRGRKGQPIGVLVAKDIGCGKVGIGWSLCSVKVSKDKGKTPDKFDFELGKNIASVRALNPKHYLLRAPATIIHDLEVFSHRCKRYFKGHTVIDVASVDC